MNNRTDADMPLSTESTDSLNSSELKRTGFFRLWTGETLSLAGAQITHFAIPLMAVLLLDADSWDMGLLAAAGSAATLVFGLSAGVLADSYERRNVMQWANVARALLLLAVPALWYLGQLGMWMLLAITFAVGALTLLFDSAMSAYLPRLVGKRHLAPANSWMEGSAAVGEVAGPGLAGVLVQTLGAPLAVLLDALSYLGSAIALRRLPRAAPESRTELRRPHFKAAVDGLRLLARDRIQRPLAAAAAHFNFFTAMFFALYTLYVVKILGFSPFVLGLFSVAGGIGGLLGSIAATRISRRFGYGVPLAVAYALPGIAALFVPLAEGRGKSAAFVMVALSQFCWVLAVVVNLVLSQTIKQSLVPDPMLGRVTSAIRFVTWGVEPFGALLAGFIGGSLFGIRATLTVAAIGLMTSALWPLTAAVRRLRTLPEAVNASTDPTKET